MHKHKVNSKIVFLVILLVLVIGVLATASWWFFAKAEQSTSDSPIESYSTEAVSRLISSGDTETARKMVATELEQNDSIEVRRDAARVNAAAGDYQAVIDAYTPAVESKSQDLNSDDYQNLAEAYESQGNKESAAKYYREAAANWPKDDPAYYAEVEYLNKYANSLEGNMDPNA